MFYNTEIFNFIEKCVSTVHSYVRCLLTDFGKATSSVEAG